MATRAWLSSMELCQSACGETDFAVIPAATALRGTRESSVHTLRGPFLSRNHGQAGGCNQPLAPDPGEFDRPDKPPSHLAGGEVVDRKHAHAHD